MKYQIQHEKYQTSELERTVSHAEQILLSGFDGNRRSQTEELMRLVSFEAEKTLLKPFEFSSSDSGQTELRVCGGWNLRLVHDILDKSKVTSIILEKIAGSGEETVRTQAVVVDLKRGLIFGHHSLNPSELREVLALISKDPAVKVYPNLAENLSKVSQAVTVKNISTGEVRDGMTLLKDLDEKYARPFLLQQAQKLQQSVKKLQELEGFVSQNLEKSPPRGVLTESQRTPFVFQGEMALVFPESSVEGLGTFGLGPCVGFGIRFMVEPNNGGPTTEIIALGHLDSSRLPMESVDQLIHLVKDWCKEKDYRVTGWEVYIAGGQVARGDPESIDLYHDLVTALTNRKDMPKPHIKILESPIGRSSSSSLAVKRSQSGYYEFQGTLTDPKELELKALRVMLDVHTGKKPLGLTVYR